MAKPTTHAELEQLKQKKLNNYFKVNDDPNTVNFTKDVDMAKRTVTGVSNTLYYFDSDSDVLISGCMDKTLAERGPDSAGAAKIKNVKDHNISQRIGRPKVLKEATVNGRKVQYFESELFPNTLGNDTLIEYQNGGIDQHSIGFRYMDLELITADDDAWSKWLAQVINPQDMEDEGYVFIVKEISQFEWSPVSFGANQLTPFLGVKSDNKPGMVLKVLERVDYLQKALKGGKQSDEILFDHELECRQLKQIITELFEEQLSIKATLLQRGRHNSADTETKDSSMRICSNCMEQFMAPTEGSAPCPACGQYMPATPGPGFDLNKAIKEFKFLTF